MQILSTFISRLLNLSILCLLIGISTVHSQTAASYPQNKIELPLSAYKLPFTWQGDTILNKWEPHSAILVPVKFEGCQKTFYMQFDLGANYSLFYSGKLKTIIKQYPDMAKTLAVNQESGTISFKLHRTKINANEIAVKNFGNADINFKDKKAIDIIGTIGSDFIDGKTVVMDYQNQQIIISPKSYSSFNKRIIFADFIYNNKSLLLPSKVNGKQTLLFFDTGSSRYALLTNKKTAESLAIPNTTVLSSKVNSWGKVVTANSLATNANIEIANTFLPMYYTTYIEGASAAQIDRMAKLGIGGMTGNQLFINYKLILDTKNQKFALVK